MSGGRRSGIAPDPCLSDRLEILMRSEWVVETVLMPAGRVDEVEDSPMAEPVMGPAGPPGQTLMPDAPRRLRGAEAAKVHVMLLVVLALCTAAFRFELDRAVGGNGLSWAYVFEWPLFAAFGFYMWWTVLQGGRTPRRAGGTLPTRPASDGLDPKYAGMLEAWQAHQQELQASQAEAEGRDLPGTTPPS
jgi:hypothetical protein